MKRLQSILITLMLFIAFAAHADSKVSFVAKAENVVAVGQKFQLTFTLNNAEASNLDLPQIDGFTIVYGPNKSTSTSMQIINGQRSVNSSTTYSYVLMPQKEGTYTIPAAKASVDGTTYRSNALTIKVIAGDSNQGAAAQGNKQNAQSQGTATISNDDIFMRTEVTKKKVNEQEQFVLTHKLYYRPNVNVRSFSDYKFPDYNGFIAHDVEIPDEKKPGKENVNGNVFNTYILKQTILIPQKSGKIETGKGDITAIILVRVQSQRGMDIFGGFYSSMRELQKPLTIPSVTIDVDPLPTKGKPENFSGAVGSYTMSTTITPESGYKTNEAITVKVKITGNGNIKYAKYPAIQFPNDFEIYDPKVDNKIKTSESGISGTKEIEYLAIARYPGEYTIPAAEFSYFDTKTKSYKTLKTPEYRLNVEKGADADQQQVIASNYTNKENVKMLGSGDIRFINTKDLDVTPKNDFFFGSVPFWLWLIIPLAIFIAAFVLLRKIAKENSNVALVRGRKANKQAIKRLTKAQSYLAEENKSAFYEETLKALWGYVGDKLNIPAIKLSKDNITAELTKRNVSNETCSEFTKLLETAEFARYAPSAAGASMQEVYDSAVNIINKLENEIKK